MTVGGMLARPPNRREDALRGDFGGIDLGPFPRTPEAPQDCWPGY